MVAGGDSARILRPWRSRNQSHGPRFSFRRGSGQRGESLFRRQGDNRVRKVDTKGIITTFAGTGTAGYSGDGGSATSAQIGLEPDGGISGRGSGYRGQRLHRGPAEQSYPYGEPVRHDQHFAGNGTPFATGSLGNGDGGPPASASVLTPYGVKVDSAGNIFIADTGHGI